MFIVVYVLFNIRQKFFNKAVKFAPLTTVNVSHVHAAVIKEDDVIWKTISQTDVESCRAAEH